jgi:hypothetical protein
MLAQVAVAVDQQQARRSLHAVGLHHDRNRVARIGAWRIDADRKRDAVLVQERLQRDGRHRGVMFEHRMEACHGDIRLGERRMDSLCLRQPVVHAGRTQHLECVQHHHAAAQCSQVQGFARVEPLAGRPRRRGLTRRVQTDHAMCDPRSRCGAMHDVTF